MPLCYPQESVLSLHTLMLLNYMQLDYIVLEILRAFPASTDVGNEEKNIDKLIIKTKSLYAKYIKKNETQYKITMEFNSIQENTYEGN